MTTASGVGAKEVLMARRVNLGAEAVADLTMTFAEAGLGPPPVPPRLAGALRSYPGWGWTTTERAIRWRKDLFCGFGPDFFVRVLGGGIPDHLVVTYRGRGVNFRGLAISLRLGPVAVVAQHFWGGENMVGDQAAATVTRWHADLAAFIRRFLHEPSSGPLRYALLYSNWVGIGRVVERDRTGTADPAGEESSDAILGWAPAPIGTDTPPDPVLEGLVELLERRRAQPQPVEATDPG
jgi:hypothetical protein